MQILSVFSLLFCRKKLYFNHKGSAMERFSSKIGTCTFLGFLIMCMIDIGLLMFWGLSGIWIPFLVFSAIFVLFVIPPFFFTHYNLTQDYLKITCLWFAMGKKIKYEDIVAVVPCDSAKVSAKLANSSIRIVYKKKNKTKEIYISPALNDRFINQLTDNVLYCSVIEEKKFDEANMKLEGITKPLYMVEEEINREEEKLVKPKPVRKTASKKTSKAPAKRATKATTRASDKKVVQKPQTKKVASIKAKTTKTIKPKTTAKKQSTTKKAAPKVAKTAKKVVKR